MSPVRPSPGTGWTLLASAVLLLFVAASPADAHGGSEDLVRPVLSRVRPSIPGVDVKVVYSAAFQLLAENTTSTELTVFAPAGEPFLRIGPGGVLANVNSPSWYDANTPEGLGRYPEGVRPGAEVEPEWARVSREPSWGWFDHRLHPATLLPPQVRRSTKPVRLGEWSIPVRHGTRQAELQGYIEYKPVVGSYTHVLKSPEAPRPGVKIQIVPGRAAPAMYLENLSPEVVTVLGRQGEPFVRVGHDKAEVNDASPTWVEIQKLTGRAPSVPAGVRQPPSWREVASTPRYAWIELRGQPPSPDPPQEIIERGAPTVVKKWTVPIQIGDSRIDVAAWTQFVPRPGLRPSSGDDGDRPARLLMVVGVGVGAMAVGLLVTRPRNRRRTTRNPADDSGGVGAEVNR